MVYTYTETEIEKGESSMKNEIRYMIAGIGLALVGLTACGGFIYTQIQEYNSKMEQRRESEPVVKWVKCEPIETTEIEHRQDDDVDVSAYEYVNVYADENGYVYRYLYMHEPQNEN